jgi:hypothetical protein
MKKSYLLLCFYFGAFVLHGQQLSLPFESNPNRTVTYEEMHTFCKKLQRMFPEVHLDSIGMTDIGLPLHYLVISDKPNTNRAKALKEGKAIVWINNGIHPGEPEGIDASLALMRDILQDDEKRKLLKKMVIVLVPSYNIDGMLNRNSHSRANQNGPDSYGFRGNARNLDLNRDFAKADSRNTHAFYALYQQWLPHIFLDNHTSNGADYQHTMTLLQSLPDKLGFPLQDFMEHVLVPKLYQKMEEANWPMCPYVVTKGQDPSEGIYAYIDSPRYSSGYAAMWGAIPLLTETHMLKPFIDRLQSNYVLMDELLKTCYEHSAALISFQEAWFTLQQSADSFEYHWQIDAEKADTIRFLGYEREMIPGKISGKPIGKYNRSKPYEKQVPHYKYSKPSKKVPVPDRFIIPHAWSEVIERLALNNIQFDTLKKDEKHTVKAYRISDFKTLQYPYEGHYLHYEIQMEEIVLDKQFRKGDISISTAQPGVKYLMEVLTPDAGDSFFAWNFFDAILMAKEGFSDYVFDDLAAEILDNDPELMKKFEAKKTEDKAFEADARAQLRYIYEASPYFERNKNIVPIFSVLN